ncbi:MAG: efflux RND transporter periplasmic adaptor subunit [Anaerolineae bacterium]|nr:efflux RND transporter periplasmic adaptor subunit [Anaerolineae bacterium]
MATVAAPGTRMARKTHKTRWWLWLALLALLGVGGYFGYQRYTAQTATAATTLQTAQVTKGNITTTVAATGNIQPVTQTDLNVHTSGTVQSLAKLGDSVKKGDTVLQLDTTDLLLAVKTAEANLESAQLKLEQARQGATEAELAASQAKVDAAQASLNGLYSGATASDLAAAQSKLRTAQLNLDKAQAGPTAIEIANAQNKIEQAKNSLWSAQSNRDSICGRVKNGDLDSSCQGARASVNNGELAVQTAQNDLQTLLAGPDANSIAVAQESVNQAQTSLAALQQGPTAESVASAKSNLIQAQSSLATLQAGPDTLTVQQAEVAVRQAQANVDEAKVKLSQAAITAPYDGIITEVNTAVGATVTTNSAPLQITDFANLQIQSPVSEMDRPKIKVGQAVNITVEALPNVTLKGEVTSISPTATMTSGVVNYPVTIKVTQGNDSLASGMTATLAIVTDSKAGVLKVPTKAIQTVNNQKVLNVQRGDQIVQVPVTVGSADSSNTEISGEVQAGDMVIIGSVSGTSSGTTTTTTTNRQGGMGVPGVMGGPGAGGPPPGP